MLTGMREEPHCGGARLVFGASNKRLFDRSVFDRIVFSRKEYGKKAFFSRKVFDEIVRSRSKVYKRKATDRTEDVREESG